MPTRTESPRFSIDQWAAWAPGLNTEADWRQWFDCMHPLDHESQPALAQMPALLRRRAKRLGRVALQVTYQIASSLDTGPLIFASRYGEMSRSVDLLRQLAQNDSLSPTDFSMAVHNAIGALYSIASQHAGQYSAIAAGDETLEAAFTEALSLLTEQQPHATVIYYDEELPPPFSVFEAQPTFARASAYRLSLTSGPGYTLESLAPEVEQAREHVKGLPADLAFLRFMLSDEHNHDHRCGTRLWQWARHAALA